MSDAIRGYIADLAAAFPSTTVTQATVQVYTRELSDLPVEDLGVVVRGLIRTSTFFPKIAEIRGRVVERVLAIPSESDALAQVANRTAWARQPDDERQDPPTLHPLVKEALDLVGGAFAFKATDEPTVIRGQFLRLYRELRSDQIETATIDGLPWMIES